MGFSYLAFYRRPGDKNRNPYGFLNCDYVGCCYRCKLAGADLLFGIHGKARVSSLLRLYVSFYRFYGRYCLSKKHPSSLLFLGTGWSELISVDWILVPETVCCCGSKKGFSNNSNRGRRFPTSYFVSVCTKTILY